MRLIRTMGVRLVDFLTLCEFILFIVMNMPLAHVSQLRLERRWVDKYNGNQHYELMVAGWEI